ncbi:hypothetical protein [Sphingobium sp.]|uniref:hypothetical protein n=1 Tax=Sphingobium sp. TaxID=1912891 RepID=UPI002B829415|nr:hypothetical protein [Sphingobium sp.]HUD94452.1 hypothetical protein [Sphingobium sp.]
MDDLVYLLKREQEELLRARYSPCPSARAGHRRTAKGYAVRIRDHELPYRSLRADGSVAFDPADFGTEGAAH